jgi:hypothetical protein
MDMDETWVNRTPKVMLETFHGFQGEGFELIVEDILALPEMPPILVRLQAAAPAGRIPIEPDRPGGLAGAEPRVPASRVRESGFDLGYRGEDEPTQAGIGEPSGPR